MPRRKRRRRDDDADMWGMGGGKDDWGHGMWSADMGADMQKSAERFGRGAARFADQVNTGIHRMAGAFEDEMKRRDGYAYHAGEPGPGPNRHRLYRDTRRGKIAGVCAGVADYFGWKVKWVRLAWIFGLIFFFPVAATSYVVAAILMKRPRDGYPVYQSTDEERFWRTYSVKPKMTYSELRHRFRALETRIEQMEYAVTSDEYGLRRQFKDLERGL